MPRVPAPGRLGLHWEENQESGEEEEAYTQVPRTKGRRQEGDSTERMKIRGTVRQKERLTERVKEKFNERHEKTDRQTGPKDRDKKTDMTESQERRKCTCG